MLETKHSPFIGLDRIDRVTLDTDLLNLLRTSRKQCISWACLQLPVFRSANWKSLYHARSDDPDLRAYTDLGFQQQRKKNRICEATVFRLIIEHFNPPLNPPTDPAPDNIPGLSQLGVRARAHTHNTNSALVSPTSMTSRLKVFYFSYAYCLVF